MPPPKTPQDSLHIEDAELTVNSAGLKATAKRVRATDPLAILALVAIVGLICATVAVGMISSNRTASTQPAVQPSSGKDSASARGP
jgi:hypothetical protein